MNTSPGPLCLVLPVELDQWEALSDDQKEGREKYQPINYTLLPTELGQSFDHTLAFLITMPVLKTLFHGYRSHGSLIIPFSSSAPSGLGL